jgi:hypothetical protein
MRTGHRRENDAKGHKPPITILIQSDETIT